MQTLRWTIRPLAFMDECRRRLGDSFSLRFLGFERPMVLISDPAAIKALYMEQANELPPGRNIVLEPILGSQSLLLQEGAEHLARRRLMLPAFHGERMRSYEAVLDEIVAAEIDSWPLHTEFPIHTRMQAITLEAILRIVFGVADGPRLERLRGVLSTVLTETASPRAQLVALATRRLARRQRLRPLRGTAEGSRRAALRRDRRAPHPARPGRARGHPLDADAGRVRGRRHDERQGAARPADDPAAGRPRDDGDGAGLELRPAAAPPEPLRQLRDSLEAGEDEYLRATISESLRLRPVLPLAGRRLAKELSVDGLTLPAGTDVTPAIWLTHTRADLYPEPFAFQPERFLGEGPESYAWIPFGGGIRRCIGASFAEFEMRIVLREVLTRCDLHKASPLPEKTGRRNITLSPKDGTPVVVTARRPAREPLAAAV